EGVQRALGTARALTQPEPLLVQSLDSVHFPRKHALVVGGIDPYDRIAALQSDQAKDEVHQHWTVGDGRQAGRSEIEGNGFRCQWVAEGVSQVGKSPGGGAATRMWGGRACQDSCRAGGNVRRDG